MSTLAGSLSAETLRDETALLAAAYVPLGDFSFLEAVLVPYPASVAPLITGPGGAGDFYFIYPAFLDLGRAQLGETAGGVRGAFKLGRTTLEAGYFASGLTPAEHRPYLSLHGHLLVDWNLSAAMAIPMSGLDWDQWDEYMRISAGLFHLVDLGLNRSLSFRVEAAVRPGERWQEATGTEAKQIIELGAPVYGIDLFPEIIYSPTDTLSLQLRALISPVDASAVSLFSVSWNVYQGLTVFSYLSLPLGDGNDLYRLDQNYLSSWTTGLEFIY